MASSKPAGTKESASEAEVKSLLAKKIELARKIRELQLEASKIDETLLTAGRAIVVACW